MDSGLPDASGLDLLRLLKTHPLGGRARLLMLTANSQLDVMTEALDCGADRYLVKPFPPKVLRRRVTQLLEGMPLP
jgi:DNA-binding response OmpR family regulator